MYNILKSKKMRILFVFLAVVLHAGVVSSQVVTSIQAQPKMNLREVLANSLQYIEPDFLLGRVIYNNGEMSQAFLNYNLLLNEIHFIQTDEETGTDRVMSLKNPQDVNFISIGRRLFIYDSRLGFLEILVNGKIKLLKKTSLEVSTKNQPSDAYGPIPITSSTTTVGSFVGENFNFNPDREDILKANTIRTEKYFSQKSSSIRPISTKKALLKLSPKKHHEELSSYLDMLKLRWNDEKNLIEYFKFANTFEKE